jgi:tetratricopeptide (TPR) repeat protein
LTILQRLPKVWIWSSGGLKRVALLVGFHLTVCGPLLAQLSTGEAMARLRERQKAREAEQHAATQPAKARDPAPTTKPSALQIGYLSHGAWKMLEDKKYKDTAAEFDKLLKLDPKDTNALEGRAISRYELNRYNAADHDAELAFNLSAKANRSSGQLTVAYACASIMDDNPMRAVKLSFGERAGVP